MILRTLLQVKLFRISLNPLVASLPTADVYATSLERLEEFLDENTNDWELYMDEELSKIFKKGSPLEMYKYPLYPKTPVSEMFLTEYFESSYIIKKRIYDSYQHMDRKSIIVDEDKLIEYLSVHQPPEEVQVCEEPKD